MDYPITTFWGKLEQTSEPPQWHPLVHHCIDVAVCVEALLELPTWESRLAKLAGLPRLHQVTKARLVVFSVLHDMGKFNLGFQAKGRPELGITAGHVREAVAAITSDREIQESLAFIDAWGDGAFGLLVTSLCHHGQPYSCDSQIHQRSRWSTKGDLDPKAGLKSLVEKCRELFPLAFEASGPEMPANAEFEHAFAGLITLADWIGSDMSFFPFSASIEVDRLHFARDAVQRFMHETWLDIDNHRRADRSDTGAFQRIAPQSFAPRPAQSAVLTLPLESSGSTVVLESETGSGKTEAALAHFIALYSAGLVDGMYFALPTRTAALQMHERVRKAMKRAFTDPPPVVQAVPGYLRTDDVEGHKLAPFTVLWDDQDRYRYRGWAAEAPKRYLAGCIIVGTIDQILLSSLMVRHAHLRATALLRHLLVVDEVHASDSYMSRILEEALVHHRAAGGHALLLSATLGGETRAQFLKAGQGRTRTELSEALAAPYPLITWNSNSMNAHDVDHSGKGRRVTMSLLPTLEDPQTVAIQALDAARQGARVLIIKNTVADCVNTQLALESTADAHGQKDLLFTCAGVFAPHHSRFAQPDRTSLDGALISMFGKERSTESGQVIVATQTVQQSLDLDADLLFTDLCPADVLLQRLGRLHRHARSRPAGYDEPQAIVIVPSNRDLGILLNEQGKGRHHHGLGSVYEDLRILEATWQMIERYHVWDIPEMNRELVERTVHSQALAEVVQVQGGNWVTHSQQMEGARRGEKRLADLNLVDWTKPYSDTTFPDDTHISTRLGLGDRRAVFSQPMTGPFGNKVRELVIPERWAQGVPSDVTEVKNIRLDDGQVVFEFGAREFIYDRLGLRLSSSSKAKGG